MNAVLVFLVGCAILVVGYIFYGGWLAKQWGVDDSRVTPAHELEDGMDYVPAKAPVLMGHHFSSIAGAGPINGPIQAAVFGWVPVVLWVLIGGIFFGAVHDYGALFASIRHKGQSIGEVIALNIGSRAKKLFLIFSYLTLILVVAAFASIVASTFQATYVDGVVDTVKSATNASVAMISLLFILMAIIFGFFVYRKGASLAVATVAGVIGIVVCLVVGLNFHPIYLSNTAWMWIIGVYILVASVAPVWILLHPRDYLSSFLLYAMMIIAAVGVLGAGIMGADLNMDMPAFTGWYDNMTVVASTGAPASLGYVFPALFVTIACGAISGFHSLVGSGTTAKQLDHERDAKPIAYGGMLIECALALVSLCAVAMQSYLFSAALSAIHIPHRVMSYCTYGDHTVLRRFRDYDDGPAADRKILEYRATSNNRDGLALAAAGVDLMRRREDHKILIVFSDGLPNDMVSGRVRAGKPKKYVGEEAVRDTCFQVRKLRRAGAYVLGIFLGDDDELENERMIYGSAFLRIRRAEDFGGSAGKRLSEILLQL